MTVANIVHRIQCLKPIWLLPVLAALPSVCSCSSSASPPPAVTTPGMDAGDDASTQGSAILVTPTAANVLTCDTLQLTGTGGSGAGTWTVSPTGEGTVTSTGLYAAPNAAPTNPAVTVTYGAGGSTASAQLQVATAFLGAPAPLPINAGTEDTSLSRFTANGSRVYVGLVASTSSASGSPYLETDIFASSDDGATFTGPVPYHTGDLECETVAVDSGNANVVYLVYLAGNGDSTSNTGETLRLAVSTDGAKTFPTEYDLAEGDSSLASFICPDVISPSPGHVIVSGYSSLMADGSTDHLATFVSSSQGAGIGPVVQQGVTSSMMDCDCEVGNDSNPTPVPNCNIYSNGGGGGPQLIANGNGGACVVFQYGPCDDATRAYNIGVQCSQDSGATWSAVTLLGVPDTDNSVTPTGALSPGGKVAVTWYGKVPVDAGGGFDTYVAVSSDGGKTFSVAAPYPNSVVGEPTGQVVAWENDTVLWLAQVTTDNAKNLYVDKTCDDGTTWSGAVKVGTGGYTGDSLVLTSAGMTAVAVLPEAISTFSLAPQ
jgi:hypothetical protein